MSKFLTYSEIDSKIQSMMSGQAPSEDTRLEAINDSVNDLYAEFDIESGKREFNLYVVADGKPISLEDYVPDFKSIADLRSLNDHKQEFVFPDDDAFEVNIGKDAKIDEYSVYYSDGKIYLKVNSSAGVESKQAHGMSSLTDNGAWTADATADALSLATEEVIVLNQSVALSFDIDVSQSANNYALIYNADMNAVDLSDYVSIGRAKFWIYLPSVTYFTSVELRWGSSNSDYYSVAVTKQANGASFQDGWNFIEIDWADAAETGSVTDSAIDYLALKLNYTSSYTNQANVVVEKIEFFLPKPMKLVYNTYYFSQTTSGTFQADMTATAADELLLPKRYKKLIVLKALQYLAPMAMGDDKEVQIAKWRRDEAKEISNLGLDIGRKVKTAVRMIKLRV